MLRPKPFQADEQRQGDFALTGLTGLIFAGIIVGVLLNMKMLHVVIAIIMIAYSIIVIIDKYVNNKLFSCHSMITFYFLIAFYLNFIRLCFLDNSDVLSDEWRNSILLISMAHILFEMGYRLLSGRDLFSEKLSVFVKRIQPSGRILPAILVFSFIGISAWIRYFMLYGGIFGYLYEGGLGHRVLMSRGYGWLLVLIDFYNIANTLFFIHVLSLWKGLVKNNVWSRFITSLFFVLHTLLYFVLVTPLGQRGGIIWKAVLLIIIFHFFYRPIKSRTIIILGAGFVILASALHYLRDSPSTYFGEFDVAISEIRETNIWEKMIKEGWGFSGYLDQCHQIINNVPQNLDFQLGMTYLSLFTQFIPRKLWPDKLDTGGIIITREITWAGEYSGTTNECPTLVGEAYLNFGIFGVMGMAFVFGLVTRRLDVLSRFLRHSPIGVYLTGILIIFSGTFLLGEFTNVISGFIYTVANITIFLIFLGILNSLKLKKRYLTGS